LENRKISEDFIEEVRQRSDIIEIISEYVQLKRTGKNYQGLCPFHSEKTPSFNVNPERQMFYCFGCHIGGNVFSFLMRKENLTFIEALKLVTQKVGLEFPEREMSSEEKEKEKQHIRWKEIHVLVNKYFSDVLLNKAEGGPGREYFAKRGLDTDDIKKFYLGYAPDKWDGLINELGLQGVKPEELEECGLVLRRSGSGNETGYYDRFRNRVIFSILDVRNSPVAFGGRVLDDSNPKYLNSPETPFFHKGKNLYGINYAVKRIREDGYALLLEGYMDVISVQKVGLLNTVASLGTALTRDQVKLLKRYTSRVVIGYDSDSAGVQATIRAGGILLDEGLRVEVLSLNDSKDPDEYLSKHSSEEFKQEIDKATTFIEFKYKILIEKDFPSSIPDKAEIIKKLAPDILKISSPVEREGYERFLSLEMGLTLEAVHYEISSHSKYKRENKGNREYFFQKQDISVKNRNNIRGKENIPNLPTVQQGGFRAEQVILRIVLENLNFIDKVRIELGEDFWSLKEHKYIFDNLSEKGLIFSEISDDFYQKVQKSLAAIYQIDIDFEKAQIMIDDCIDSINFVQNRKKIEDLQAKMISLEKSGDVASAMDLLREIGELLKRGEK